ncbi:helix-turn-helix domain-containing protein [Clostridia bacterium OttesenSCG-928-O13]|nr:helix-turn-helix domain-containing protein [Clostridia bacterium OttesenSCG-928-O13]
MTKEEIGAILRDLRLKSGKTQKEVAELLGRTQQVVGHWETGYSQPDANTLFLLCTIYGADLNEAFGFNKKSASATAQDGLPGNSPSAIDATREKYRNHPTQKSFFSLADKATPEDMDAAYNIAIAYLKGKGYSSDE